MQKFGRKLNVIFVLDHPLHTYRLPFFQQLNNRGYNLSVIHTGEYLQDADYIQQIKSDVKFRFLGFEVRDNIAFNDADIVVFMQNIRIINLWVASLNPFKKYKLIHWGIGTSSSKGLSLNKNIISRIRSFLSQMASAVILYSAYPISLFSERVQKNIFVANNTIYNPKPIDFSKFKKEYFLFIGSLNKRKGLDILINTYHEYIKESNNSFGLLIVGEGPEKGNLISLVKKLNLENNILFAGRVQSDEKKSNIFSKAIASISPLQAGLSVLESFSYGVPFVTYKNAVSGGEHLNIIDDVNGYLVSSKEELKMALVKLSHDKDSSQRLGCEAYKHYSSKRQMKHMVDSFDEAFRYSLQEKSSA